MGLLLKHFDYKNVLLDMLSISNYGLAIQPLQCLKWETAVLKAVIDNMKENERIHNPTNLQRDVL